MHSFIDQKMTECKLNTYERTAVLSLTYLTTKKNNQNHTEHFNPYTTQLTNPKKLTSHHRSYELKKHEIQYCSSISFCEENSIEWLDYYVNLL